jgi:hypothetical protein
MDRGLSVADWIRNGEEVGELEVDLNRPNAEKGLVTIRRRMTRSTVIHTRAKASLRLSSACAPLSRLTCDSVGLLPALLLLPGRVTILDRRRAEKGEGSPRLCTGSGLSAR